MGAEAIIAIISAGLNALMRFRESAMQISGETQIPTIAEILADNEALQKKIDAEK